MANPTAILSSYSTLWGLLALGLLFLLLYKLSERNLIVSAGLSAYYALTYFFWFYSVTSEQYTSAVLLTLGMVALALAWDESSRDRYLYGLAFLFGLALAHLVTVLFLAPGILLFILSKQPNLLKRGRLLLKALFVALLPLLSYAFVYVRGAQHPEWRGEGDWASAGAWFVAFISTQQGRDELTWTLGPLTDGFPSMIWQEISLILLALGVVGWWLLGRRHLLMFGLTAVIYLLFSYVDRYGNWFQVIMPLYPLFVLGAGVSLARLWRASPQRVWQVALTLGLLALIIPKLFTSYPLADQRNRADDTGLEPGRAILAAIPPDAIVLATTEERLALDYLATVWEEGAGVQVINTKKLGAALDTDRRSSSPGRLRPTPPARRGCPCITTAGRATCYWSMTWDCRPRPSAGWNASCSYWAMACNCSGTASSRGPRLAFGRCASPCKRMPRPLTTGRSACACCKAKARSPSKTIPPRPWVSRPPLRLFPAISCSIVSSSAWIPASSPMACVSFSIVSLPMGHSAILQTCGCRRRISRIGITAQSKTFLVLFNRRFRR